MLFFVTFACIFLRWCCCVAIWPPFTFPCTRSGSTQFLSAKFLCFGFASTNHVARNHIDRNVYGPHCVQLVCPHALRLAPRCQHMLSILRTNTWDTLDGKLVHCKYLPLSHTKMGQRKVLTVDMISVLSWRQTRDDGRKLSIFNQSVLRVSVRV